MSAKNMHHQLCAVAQSQNRNSKFKQFLAASCCTFLIATVRTTGKDNALRVHLFNFLDAGLVGINFTVHITFPDPACH